MIAGRVAGTLRSIRSDEGVRGGRRIVLPRTAPAQLPQPVFVDPDGLMDVVRGDDVTVAVPRR